MKKLYLFLILAATFLTAKSQFVLQNNSHVLRSGDEHYFNLCNTAGEGPSGPAQIWDFSKLETQSQLTSYMYHPDETNHAFDIPDANAVLEEFETKFFFRTSPNMIEQYGTISKNNTISRYDKPFVKMIFPFSYGDIYVGDFSGNVEGKNNYTATFTGSYTLEADAYGTLILPNKTYHNVVRIKTIKEQCFNNNACNCGTISYKWYAKNIRYPLLTIIKTFSNSGERVIQTAYYSKIKESKAEITNEPLWENIIKANIYPNPFENEFTIDYLLSEDSDITIEIYDQSGRKLYAVNKKNQKAGFYNEIIKNDDIGEQLGMYHIRIVAGDTHISKTVVRSE
ncbi:MAG: T9SS type A sorting domain-containing protein [Thiohalospira sp.]